MPDYQPKHNAPRLLAFLKKIIKATPFQMKREDWNELKASFRLNKNEFDELINTPLSDTPNVIGCMAKEIEHDKFEIKLYRYDRKDTLPVNVDVYHVFESITSIPNFLEIVKRASTDYDDNMNSFDTEVVIWSKKQPQSDHHLGFCDLPQQLWKRAKKYKQDFHSFTR